MRIKKLMAKQSIKSTDIKKIHDRVVTIAETVGVKLLRWQRKLNDLKISSKDAQGVVSNADIEAENFLIKSLIPILPGAEFLAEESAYAKFGGKGKALKEYAKKEFTWIIDPLDGTTNFLNNMDYFGVCISLVHYGEPILGIVHRPPTQQTFSAIKGKGAFLTDLHGRKKRLKLDETKKSLKDSLLVTGFACEKGAPFNREFTIFKRMMGECRGVRRMGSAALDICLVAQGIFDSFWERGLAPWDVAASSLILTEAGGVLTDYQGREFNPFLDTIVTSKKGLHTQVLNVINND